MSVVGRIGCVADTELRTRTATYRLRPATRDDLPAVIALLAADQLGATREETGDLAPYETAFAEIDGDPAQQLIVATARDGEVVATMQLTVIPGLARRGGRRLQIEAVRVAEAHRGDGLGAAMMTWAVDEARRQSCTLVQLTSDSSRRDAHRFYERLGFVGSHVGYKLLL